VTHATYTSGLHHEYRHVWAHFRIGASEVRVLGLKEKKTGKNSTKNSSTAQGGRVDMYEGGGWQAYDGKNWFPFDP